MPGVRYQWDNGFSNFNSNIYSYNHRLLTYFVPGIGNRDFSPPLLTYRFLIGVKLKPTIVTCRLLYPSFFLHSSLLVADFLRKYMETLSESSSGKGNYLKNLYTT